MCVRQMYPLVAVKTFSIDLFFWEAPRKSGKVTVEGNSFNGKGLIASKCVAWSNEDKLKRQRGQQNGFPTCEER